MLVATFVCKELIKRRFQGGRLPGIGVLPVGQAIVIQLPEAFAEVL